MVLSSDAEAHGLTQADGPCLCQVESRPNRVDGCEIHQLIGGKHPNIPLFTGFQPSQGGSRAFIHVYPMISQVSTILFVVQDCRISQPSTAWIISKLMQMKTYAPRFVVQYLPPQEL